ncbi:MAG: methyl-accepting chemotaxis protein [Gallionellaceae bacterium]|nr:methyl-accepting chemotaxis protein [Gallionellaceae bacterium]
MRVNMPVTGVERLMREGETIVSTTDARGVITHVNDTFVSISGFTRDELLGSPQNIVRHPDMPAEAFKDLWDNLQAGRPWVGLVKNRAKNGDHYWVEAHVTPLRQNGQTTGYLSVRRKPERDQVAAAEALYKSVRDGQARLRPAGLLSSLKRLSIKARLAAIMTMVVGMILVGSAIGLGGQAITNGDMARLYQSNLEPIRLVGQIVRLMSENQTQVALAVQHDPNSVFSARHDHPVDKHADVIFANRDKITALITEFDKIEIPAETRVAAAAFAEARTRYVKEGLQPAVKALKAANYSEATDVLLAKVNPLYSEARDKMEILRQSLQDSARTDYEHADARYHNLLNLGLAGMTLGVLLALWFAWLLIRDIVKPLQRTIGLFHSIAEGNYLNHIQIDRHDEVGQVLEGLESMQTKLGFDMEETRRAANENLRIKIALDSITSAVTLSQADNTLIYMNPAAGKLFDAMAPELGKRLPGFSAQSLMGGRVSQLFEDEELKAAYAEPFRNNRVFDTHVASHTLRLSASPVYNAEGAYAGRVTQWQDRTNEVAVEKEVASLVNAAAAGDFSQRLKAEGKEGFFLQLAEGINHLVETSERGMNDVARVLKALASGDLGERIDADYQGLIGQLKDDANGTAAKLSEIVSQIREATDSINTAAREIASGNADLSGRTESQASSLEETAASMDEITSTVRQNADNARQANQLAKGASDIAMKGGSVVSEVVHTMGSIADSSKKIADIISVIDGIAFQTNILALNAAVEAARAGEQGRGFAVVAGEVRSLAQRSAGAAKEIKTLIGDSVDKVNIGYKQVEQAGNTMKEIVDAVKRVTDIMGEISAASTEQTQGIEQVNSAIAQMDEVTQQNAALVEEAAAAAESLQDQAASLTQAVAVFRTAPAAAGTRNTRAPARSLARAPAPAPRAPGPVRAMAKTAPAIPAGAGSDDEWEEF